MTRYSHFPGLCPVSRTKYRVWGDRTVSQLRSNACHGVNIDHSGRKTHVRATKVPYNIPTPGVNCSLMMSNSSSFISTKVESTWHRMGNTKKAAWMKGLESSCRYYGMADTKFARTTNTLKRNGDDAQMTFILSGWI